MAEFSQMRALDVWYARIDLKTAVMSFRSKATAARISKRRDEAEARTVAEHDFPKLAQRRGGRYAIKDNPPLVYHHQDFGMETGRKVIEAAFAGYRETLPADRRAVLDRFHAADYALKVVGVGSVGTHCAILLMMAEDDDPLFLQVKEARPSVLEPYLGKSAHATHGERVVVGQRLMQSASDIFLGWTVGARGRHFYIRQLRDAKITPLVELFDPTTMSDYAALCGWTLARAHARSGDAALISGYLGSSDVFDRAIARFSAAYADQGERDHEAFVEAIRKGRIEAEMER
jgi:hypothetical protein